MKLSFYGAAGEVTGSNYLLEIGEQKLLIDCGLFQGSKFAQDNNFEPFAYSAADISAIFITHAHLDHIGRLPVLYHQGCKAPIYCTPPTKDLLLIGLQDSQEILAQEASEAGSEPLYERQDIDTLSPYIKPIEYATSISLGSTQVEFLNAGHILGSSMIRIRAQGKTIIFSGDLGNAASPLFDPPAAIGEADYVVMEATYGDREHIGTMSRADVLENTIEDTARAGGALMIPAFALERTQDILYDLDSLVSQDRIPQIPVFVDSPLAIKATQVYEAYPAYYQAAIRQQMEQGKKIFQFPGLVIAETVEQSKSINEVLPPKVIIAGSGMSQGGRILHHERRYLPDERSTLLLVGYQAQGSLGRRLKEGVPSVRIFGEQVSVRCKVFFLDGYSAHADKRNLFDWVKPAKESIKNVFLVHGEQETLQVFSNELNDLLGISVSIPTKGESVTLE